LNCVGKGDKMVLVVGDNSDLGIFRESLRLLSQVSMHSTLERKSTYHWEAMLAEELWSLGFPRLI
jgi:hypothetical protein